MAKRFTDSNKWNDDWFFNLNNEEKLAWIFILDNCDHAGIWKKNLRILNFQLGSNFVEDDLKRIFTGKIIEIKDKWFIPNFIKFQYGKTFLTSNTKAVVSARELLIDIGFIQQDNTGTLTLIKELHNSNLTLTKELDKSYDTLKDKDKDKEQVKVKEKNKEIEKVINKVKEKFEYKTKEQRDNMSEEELAQYYIQLDLYNKLIENEN